MKPLRYPTLFVSHGTPMLAFGDDPFFEKLRRFAQSFPKPKAVVVVSAHSVSSHAVHVLRTQTNRIQHDFMGFPKELYQVQYSCPGDPLLADQIGGLLQVANFEVKFDAEAPLDHGIWVPMMGLYPAGDVPLVRVSLPLNVIPGQILKMGHALSQLREQGVLVIGTGGAVHNLSELQWSQKNGPGAAWAIEFEKWLLDMLARKDVESLLCAEEHPNFFRAHPSNEHFIPLYFTVGAALPQDELEVIHQGIEYGSLSMLSFFLNSKKDFHDSVALH